MSKISKIINKNKGYFITGLIGLVIVALVVFHQKEEVAAYTVGKGNVTQSIILSGKVDTVDKADLGFAESGRIAHVFVKNNQSVSEGDILAQLEVGDLLADLKIKKLNSNTSDVSLENAKENLTKVTKQEDTKVASSYRKLLSEGLEFIADETDYIVSAPTVTGIYTGEEGQYKIIIEKDSPTDTHFIARVFGLERAVTKINDEGPTPLGTKGLYISFPKGNQDSYRSTTWILNIPNKASSFYTENYNAYNEAKVERDVAVRNAQANYDELLSGSGNGSGVAQAEIEKIYAEIKRNTIYAPFSGIVTNIEKDVGENASIGERVITVLGEKKLEVVLQVSELDVSKLTPGASIEISLDAFPNETFLGVLDTVNSRETEVDGVPVYEAFAKLAVDDPMVKTGMNAKGTIVLGIRTDVLVIPNYLVKKDNDSTRVMVRLLDGKTEEREIALGLIGTDNNVEVISGLDVGDQVISFPTTK